MGKANSSFFPGIGHILIAFSDFSVNLSYLGFKAILFGLYLNLDFQP